MPSDTDNVSYKTVGSGDSVPVTKADIEYCKKEIARLSETLQNLEKALAEQIKIYNGHIAGLHVHKIQGTN